MSMRWLGSCRAGGIAALAAGFLAATAPAASAQSNVNEDPWEGFNRPVFWFNDQVDVYFLEPVARGYDWVMPEFLQDCISNFFENIRVPINTTNALLQGKPREAGVAVGRFLFNTTVGFAGFFDPAQSELGLEPVNEDFGQTLGRWGIGSGPFLVLPLIGPSTPRDAVGLGVDGALALYQWFVPAVATLATRGTQIVNGRASVLEQVEASRASALDYYVFVRNAYLQYRQNLIEDQGTRTDEDLYQLDVD